jgi:hypothetical protein
MSQKYEDILKNSVEKLTLGPGDLLIVKSPEAMNTFIELTQAGIGFSPYANPILLVPGGLEKATRQDLLEVLSVIDQHAAERAAVADTTSRIITDLSSPILKRVQ